MFFISTNVVTINSVMLTYMRKYLLEWKYSKIDRHTHVPTHLDSHLRKHTHTIKRALLHHHQHTILTSYVQTQTPSDVHRLYTSIQFIQTCFANVQTYNLQTHYNSGLSLLRDGRIAEGIVRYSGVFELIVLFIFKCS